VLLLVDRTLLGVRLVGDRLLALLGRLRDRVGVAA
jgi:hypothetical protein